MWMQPESIYTSVGHYSDTVVDSSYSSEAIYSEWVVVPELCLQEENNKSETID